MRNWKVFTNQEKITLETLRLSYKNGSNIVTHAWLNDHSVDFNNSHVNDQGNFYMRGNWNPGIRCSQLKQIITQNHNPDKLFLQIVLIRGSFLNF